MRQKIRDLVFNIINQNYSDLEITESSLLQDLPLEDIDYTEIAIECEEKFDIILDEFKMEKMINLKELIDYINNENLMKE